jgi:hypothetical protein
MVPSAEEDEKKAPSLNRLMKSKLEKLVAKKDATYVCPQISMPYSQNLHI